MGNRTKWAVAVMLAVFIGLWLADGLTDGLGILLYPDHAQFKQWYPRFHVPAFIAMRGAYPVLLALLSFLLLRGVVRLSASWSLWTALCQGGIVALAQGHLSIAVLTVYALLLTGLAFIYSKRQQLVSAIRPYVGERSDAFNASRPWLTLLMLAAAGLRVWLLFTTDNSESADAACRYLLAQMWADFYVPSSDWRAIFNPTPLWLPLHFWLSGVIHLVTESQTVLRAAHVLAGLLGAMYLFRSARLIAGNTAVPHIATIGYLLYPAAIASSLQVLSEPWYIMFLLMAIYHFLKEGERGGSASLWWRVGAVIAASLLRYEGWGLPLVFLILSVIRDLGLTRAQVAASVVSFAGAAAVTMENWSAGRFPVWGMWMNQQMVDYNYTLVSLDLGLFMEEYRASWVPLAFLAAVAVPLIHHGNERLRYYALVIVAVLIPFAYGTLVGTVYPESRYLTQYSVLFMLPLAYLTHGLATRLLGRSVIGLLAATLLTVACASFGKAHIFPHRMHFPQGFNESIGYVHRHVGQSGFIIDHHLNSGNYQWMAELRMPYVPLESHLDSFHYHVSEQIDFEAIDAVVRTRPQRFPHRANYVVNHFDQAFGLVRDEEMREVLSNHGPVHVMVFPDGLLAAHLALEGDSGEWEGFRFTRVFNLNGYSLYFAEQRN